MINVSYFISEIMDISCPGFAGISVADETSDYGSRESSITESDSIDGFVLTSFGVSGKFNFH